MSPIAVQSSSKILGPFFLPMRLKVAVHYSRGNIDSTGMSQANWYYTEGQSEIAFLKNPAVKACPFLVLLFPWTDLKASGYSPFAQHHLEG
jgi:hypothetical protein